MESRFNPDNYLETPRGRVWTPERNQMAWEKSWHVFAEAFVKSGIALVAYIVFGIQAAGKSRWISENKACILSPAVVFDAALPQRKHRKTAIDIAQKYTRKIIGVWIKVSLSTALAQHQLRAENQIIPEQAIKGVFNRLQPPSEDEGFSEIVIVERTCHKP